MKHIIKKSVSLLLALIMVISVFAIAPLTASAANDYTINSTTSTDGYYNLISKKDWDIAPGITESEIVLNNDAGSRRQQLFVMEADLNNEYVKVINSYNGMVPQYGSYKTGIMSEQAAYAEANGYGNVVGAMNTCLSWYTNYPADRVGEPLGFIMLDAEVLFDPANCGYTYGNVGFPSVLVINKDFNENGEARPDNIPKVEMPQLKSAADLDGWEDQVIPVSSGYIVKDGKNMQKSANHSDAAPRSVVGIKPDGTVVIMLNDGRQEPYSAGMSMYELAEVMLDLGCTFAVNCDGGGSSTYLSQRPGEELKVTNSPSDGAERPTTTGILFITTAPADGAFARATISTEGTYYTPNSTVKFDALGTDLVGTVTEIPDDATWQLADPSMGTIEDGVFVSNGKVGTVTAQMVYEDKVVGEHSIEIVIPTEFAFSQEVMTVPFDKEVTIGFTATINDGLNDVIIKPEDVELTTTNDALGTFDGFKFTSVSADNAPENLKSVLTATLVHNTELVATASLNLGKGSEVLFDFEDASDIEKWNIADVNGNDKGFYQHLSFATAENGQVHNGEGSMRVEMNPISANGISNGGYAQSDLFLDEGVVVENAKSIGFWAYIPDEYEHCWIRVLYWYDPDGDGKFDKKNTISVINQPEVYNKVDQSGWKYFSVDVSAYNKVLIPGLDCKDRIAYNASKNDANNFRFVEFMFPHTNTNDLWKTYGTINGLQTVYVDNITADFSDAIDDREEPIFGSVELLEIDKSTVIEKYNPVTTNSNLISATVTVKENTAKSNATGLNADSAKAYVDGVEVPVTYSNGRMTISEIAVANGMHRVKFEICDNMGNKAVIIRLVNVASNVDASTVQLVPADSSLDSLYGGSVYFMDMNANKIETIKSVEAVIDLNYGNHFELDNIVLADGFTSKYTIDEENNTATLVITRTGENTQTGEATLASLPIRVIYYDTDIKIDGYTAQSYWDSYGFWPYDLKVDVDMGKITYVDDYDSEVLGAFSNEEFSVDTELQTAFSDATFKAERGTAHVHTESAMDDGAATCKKTGYKDRTFCEVCNSVVDWGTVTPVADHSYEVIDGKLTCVSGGELFNGVYTDGKTYIDGVVIGDGWVGESYYKDGVMLTGVNEIDGKYYNFGEDGICAGKYPMSAEWWTNEKGESFYFNNGVPTVEYALIGGAPTNFDKNGVAFQGEVEINGETCIFEKGVFVESTTARVEIAGRIGPDAYYVYYKNGTVEICGSGATYDFVSVGNTSLPKLSWKNRPWGRNTDLSNGIEKVVIGNGITTLGDYLFYQCYNIETIEFEENSHLTAINRVVFNYLPKLKSIELPESLRTIGNQAFGYNERLVNVVLPQKVNYIQYNAFVNSKKVVLNVAEGTYAESFAINNKIAYETRTFVEDVVAEGSFGENLTWTLYESGKLVIGGTGAMPDFASRNDQPWAKYRDDIKSIEIGKDVTSLGKYAFAYAYSVKSVTFDADSKLEKIGAAALYYLSDLKEITLPDTVKRIENLGLAYNGKLVDVYMPQRIGYIQYNAFNNSSKVVLNVAEGTYAESFAVKYNLEHTTRAFVEDVIAEGTFGENLTWTFFESGKLVIDGAGAMPDFASRNDQPWAEYRDDIYSIVIGKDVTYLGKYAFAYAYSVKSVTFEEGSALEKIGAAALYYLTDLKEITLPETVKRIENLGLAYNGNLVNVYVPQGVAYIQYNAFNNSKKVVLDVAKDTYAESFAVKYNLAHTTRAFVEGVVDEGTFGENLTWTFYESGKLVIGGTGAMPDFASRNEQPWAKYRDGVYSIEIGKDVTYLGMYAFAYSHSVKSVTFEEGSKLEKIGVASLYYLSELKEIKLPETVKRIEKLGLAYNGKLVNVYVPQGVSFIHQNAFVNSSKAVLNVAADSYAQTVASNYGWTYTTR